MRLLSIFFVTTILWCACARRTLREILHGDCYDVHTSSTLDLNKWSNGRWYEIRRYENEFQSNSKCASQVYFVDENKGTLDVNFSFQRENGSLAILKGSVNYTRTTDEVIMNVTFPHDSMTSSFDILATDIDNYAIVYSCWLLPSGGLIPEKQERLWVLSRTPSFSNETSTNVANALLYNGTDLGRYSVDVAQDNCS